MTRRLSVVRNQWNRGSLLVRYRDLVERMEVLGIERTRWNGDGRSPTEESSRHPISRDP